MAEKEGFEVDQLGVMEGTSFSQLLYEVEHDVVGLSVADHHHQTQIFNYNNSCSSLYSATSDLKAPKMLCFGDFQNKDSNNLHLGDIGFPEISVSRPPAQKSGLTCSDSSSVSSTSAKSNNNKKRNGVAQEQVQCASKDTQTGQRSSKKPKTDKPAATGKRREKLGERISALQQLVSPFGKTDTASVLHEAMGYIRFLHDQVQVLCSPYLERLPSLPEGGDGAEKEEAVAVRSNGLRSRGLCLVPMEYTAHVANNNGADFWSPATMANKDDNNNVSSLGY